MGPLKKRKKVSSKANISQKTLVGSQTKASIESIDSLVGDLTMQIKGLEPSDHDAFRAIQDGLLLLKKRQREMFLQLQDYTSAFENKERQNEKQGRALAALDYESAYLEREIEACQNFATPHLEKLAREETSESKKKSTDDVLLEFLQADVHKPQQKQQIIAKLHQELNARGGLERDLKLKQKELEKAKEKLKWKNQLLDGLPDQLASLERASMPLQKFVLAKSKNTSLRMIGTERRTRLDLAKSLPPPLYTTFQQLQQYMDCSDSPTDDNISITVTGESDYNNKQVLLQIPIPDVTSSTSPNNRPGKRVLIHFHYYADRNIVTAVASGASTTLNQEILLDELFPGDCPPPVQTTVGRPYYWCNYLAGIHVVIDSSSQQTTTRVIVHELLRRIRANATLKLILHALHRQSVPVPPNSREEQDSKISGRAACKLASFSLNRKDGADSKDRSSFSSSTKGYTATFRKGTASLVAKVQLHAACYPATPPVWTLSMENNDLYDDRFALLERQVNIEALDRFVQTDQESSYDWILVYQLREIMRQWDSWLDNESNSDSGRSRKGRDRVPLEMEKF